MRAFELGDQVAVLHDTITGTIIEISGNTIKIEDTDGFSRSYNKDHLVLKPSSNDYKIGADIAIKDFDQPNSRPQAAPIFKKISHDQFEIDLHIEELTDRPANLTNFEIVRMQMTACRSFVQQSIDAGRKRIVLIHGKGEGVLMAEIRQYLERLSSSHGIRLEYHDASYQRYGMGGATEVVFYK